MRCRSEKALGSAINLATACDESALGPLVPQIVTCAALIRSYSCEQFVSLCVDDDHEQMDIFTHSPFRTCLQGYN